MTELALNKPQAKASKKKLALESLEIKNFRPFQNLRIEKLGRVNLIVGKNSVGKSSVLEALQLYANQGSLSTIIEVLEGRNEYSARRTRTVARAEISENLASSVKYLFFGRNNLNDLPAPIQIGTINESNSVLIITISWYAEQTDEEGGRKLQPINPEDYGDINDRVLGLAINFGKQPQRIFRLNRDYRFPNGIEGNHLPSIFIPTGGLSNEDLGKLWNIITLTPLEDDVTKGMQIIEPQAERVAVLTDSSASIVVKIQGNNRVPLQSLGDGMRRIFGIILALVNSQDGFLLVDEIENGLHYSVQLDLWRIIFEVARRLNVQVFATTHNWDCIEAFQKAASEDQQSEGMLIRLQHRRDKLVTTLYDEHDLAIATKQEIEVR